MSTAFKIIVSHAFVQYVGLEILTLVVMKRSVFWDKMPHLEANKHLGETFRFHLRGQRIC
jgi:hypothetical protein